MTEKPRIGLARAFGRIEQRQIPTVAAKAGVSARQVSNLLVGRPVKAVAFFRLCAALGHDPLPALPHSELIEPGDIDLAMLAMGCRIKRGLNKHSVRKAGEAMGISGFTVSRLENAHITSVGVVLKVANYVGVHPFNYFRLDFTKNIHSNAMNDKEKVETVTAP